jgi:hypothetical protein
MSHLLQFVPQDTTKSWSSLLEKNFETNVLRSADLSEIRQMSGALPECRVLSNVHQELLQWLSHFRSLFRL